jgi:hypothetical protein
MNTTGVRLAEGHRDCPIGLGLCGARSDPPHFYSLLLLTPSFATIFSLGKFTLDFEKRICCCRIRKDEVVGIAGHDLSGSSMIRNVKMQCGRIGYRLALETTFAHWQLEHACRVWCWPWRPSASGYMRWVAAAFRFSSLKPPVCLSASRMLPALHSERSPMFFPASSAPPLSLLWVKATSRNDALSLPSAQLSDPREIQEVPVSLHTRRCTLISR